MQNNTRSLLVFAGLVCVLTLTCALLLALAPHPLTPDATGSLLAVDQANDLQAVFKTKKPVTRDRWKYIYIHHTATPDGNAATLGRAGQLVDHFVIGNGDGAIDGEIQMTHRWDNQLAAGAPQGAESIDPACINIALIGDIDTRSPTMTQTRRLTQLVNTLQARLKVPADNVILMNAPGLPAGMGRAFPAKTLRENLLP